MWPVACHRWRAVRIEYLFFNLRMGAGGAQTERVFIDVELRAKG